jgi:predicted dehydrogenase
MICSRNTRHVRALARRYKAGLLGLGVMGRRHARVLAAMPDRFDLTGAYDPREDIPWPAGLPQLACEAEVIARSEVVVVATPIGAHAATVARALAAGRHVLVEKPLCETTEQAESLVAAAARGPARLFVGHSERFNPVVRALSKLVRVDRVIALDFMRVGPARPTDHGVLLNLGVHDFDLAGYLGGGVATVHGAAGVPSIRGSGDEVAHVLLTTSAGALVHVYVDRTVPEKRRRIMLATARWIYEGDLLGYRLARTARGTGVSTGVPLPLEEPLAAQAAALADALDGRAVREIATGADGARALVVAEQAAARCAEKLSLLAAP